MYGKIFEEIYSGSLIADGGVLGVYVFTGMIVLADERGVVPMDERILYRALGLESDGRYTFDEFMAVIDKLCSPDKFSNLATEEGRRIIPLNLLDQFDGNRGYMIVNYDYYRHKGSRSDRAEYQKTYYESKTKKKRARNSTLVNTCQHLSTDSIHTDTDTDTDIIKKTASRFSPPSIDDVRAYCQERNNGVNPESFVNHYEANGWMRGKSKIKDWKACVRTWEKKEKPDDYFKGAI